MTRCSVPVPWRTFAAGKGGYVRPFPAIWEAKYSMRVAYVLLWFPKPSETFVFQEIACLRRLGLDVRVHSLYGRLTRCLSPEMAAASRQVERLGIRGLPRLLGAVLYWWRRRPSAAAALTRRVVFRRWRDAEAAGENLWACWCGFHLARRFQAERIAHIHAPWAAGPATAAWVASTLTGTPFSFAAHAHDIYPPDGALNDKLRDASFVRAISRANMRYLGNHAPAHAAKLRMIHNGYPERDRPTAAVPMTPPCRLAALGRFVRKKGFDVLLQACRVLTDRGVDFRLALGGAGPEERRLKRLAAALRMGDRVRFPGFVRYDAVPAFLLDADVFVMPSVVAPSGDRDGIPSVVLEALLHRVPVVASDVGGMTEVVRDGLTGLLVPPGDPLALSDAIARLIGDRAFAIRAAEAGRDLARREFRLDAGCAQLIDLFRLHAAEGSRQPASRSPAGSASGRSACCTPVGSRT